MKLYLSSYGLGNDTSYLKKWIKENDNKLLFINNAQDNDELETDFKEKLANKIKLLEDIGFKVTLLDLRNYFNNKKLIDDIKEYNCFFIRGGNTFVLRKAFELSLFDKYLVDNKNNDSILYIGESAGACVLSDTLKGVEIEDEPINIYNSDSVSYDGVGLIDFSPVPHYKSQYVDPKIIEDTIKYLEDNNIKYKTIKDGDVIII